MEALILEITLEELVQRIRGYLEALGDLPPIILPTILHLYEDRPLVVLVEFARPGVGKVSLEVETLAPGRIQVAEGDRTDKSPETKELLRDFWRELGPGKRGGPHQMPREQQKEFAREWMEIRGRRGEESESQENFSARRGFASSTLRGWVKKYEPEIRAERMRSRD